jgi:hypothetical protein
MMDESSEGTQQDVPIEIDQTPPKRVRLESDQLEQMSKEDLIARSLF